MALNWIAAVAAVALGLVTTIPAHAAAFGTAPVTIAAAAR